MVLDIAGPEGLEERERFTALRRRHGLTQAQVAAEAGTKQSEVSRWERGRAEPAGRAEALWDALRRLAEGAAAGAAS